MAQKVQVTLVDDIDGGGADETVTFSLDGTNYEIDLSSANANALRESFATYVGHGRRVGGGRRGAGRGRVTRVVNPAEVRAWAKGRGIPVNDRGRIPADLQAQFLAAKG